MFTRIADSLPENIHASADNLLTLNECKIECPTVPLDLLFIMSGIQSLYIHSLVSQEIII